MKIAFHPKLLDCRPPTAVRNSARMSPPESLSGTGAAAGNGLRDRQRLLADGRDLTGIVAGLLISLFGGSRVQIGGPTGAFIPIIYGIVAVHGFVNLLGATMLAGAFLLAMGLARMGQLIRFIPVTVVIGFTNGIAVVIFLAQIKDFLRPAHRRTAGRILRPHPDAGGARAHRRLFADARAGDGLPAVPPFYNRLANLFCPCCAAFPARSRCC